MQTPFKQILKFLRLSHLCNNPNIFYKDVQVQIKYTLSKGHVMLNTERLI